MFLEGMDTDVEGLLLPDGARGHRRAGPGAAGQRPRVHRADAVQVRQFYGEEAGLELFEIEDEIYEAEVLYGDGDFRSYVKAQAQCQQGSLLIVLRGAG
jgi:hypothetical protein